MNHERGEGKGKTRCVKDIDYQDKPGYSNKRQREKTERVKEQRQSHRLQLAKFLDEFPGNIEAEEDKKATRETVHGH